MRAFTAVRALDRDQRNTFVASFLGWTLDAFDYFLITFVIIRLAAEFHQSVPHILWAVTATLIARPFGALLFGMLADKYGRRTPLMADIAFYSAVELLTAFLPNFTAFLVLRFFYGLGMGGEWGVGAAVAMEALPAQARGMFSGLLQQGYAFGYLLAAIAYWLVFPHFGWRGMFVVGTLPALLVLFIRSHVPESRVWRQGRAAALGTPNIFRTFASHPGLFLYAIALMAAFNFMSHGTQDLYPTFLQKQIGLRVGQVSLVVIVANIGAICGGTIFGALSQRFGRRRAIGAATVFGALAIPLWVFSASLGALFAGGFLLQFMVQGAWGVIPAHLNELAPGDVRGTFPGLTYQMGNLIAAGIAQMQAGFAQRFPLSGGGANYAEALAILAVMAFLAAIVLALGGPEARDIDLAGVR
ncbi:MAG: MFS transporter [Candidatus Eremiobacteraeota bacterium]|nr:MFS transporter [Candidatus Eremiobacteraeota bacterium]